jgi:DNA-binding NarL/FixJ family response regulator
MRFLNVLIADSHPIFVEGLQAVLSRTSDRHQYAIRGIARSGDQVLEQLRQFQADLLLFDLNLPDTEAVKILQEVKRNSSQTRILVMTAVDDPRMVKAAFKAGADGYMLKSGTRDELMRAIQEVNDGQTFLGRGVVLSDHALPAGGADAGLPERRFARKHGLTKREIEIMRLIGQAMSNKEIAEKLYISDQTASVHRKNIMRKLQVNNTANLIKLAYENNLVV